MDDIMNKLFSGAIINVNSENGKERDTPHM